MAARGVSVPMTEDKETKNTIRFIEDADGDKEPLVGILYVPKATISELSKGAHLPTGEPVHIRVTVEVVYP